MTIQKPLTSAFFWILLNYPTFPKLFHIRPINKSLLLGTDKAEIKKQTYKTASKATQSIIIFIDQQ